MTFRLSFDKHGNFQREVEKDHFRIDVLGNMKFGSRKLVHQVNDVPFINERRKTNGKCETNGGVYRPASGKI